MKFLIAIEPGTDATAFGVVVPDLPGWIWAMVDVPVEKYFGPAEKINITVPARVLARIDDCARRHGESRSGFLVCHRPPYWIHFVIGMMEPVDDRHIGATA